MATRPLEPGTTRDSVERRLDRQPDVRHAIAERAGSRGRIYRAAAIQSHRPQPTGRVESVLRGGGRPLDTAQRASMQDRFGHDFGRVRLHDTAEAARSAEELSAEAYTVGHHVVFAAGRYQPSASAGRLLLAHELAHVVQQRDAPPSGPIEVGPSRDALELEAERAGRAVLVGERPIAVERSTRQRISRQERVPVGEPSWYERMRERAYQAIIEALRAEQRAETARLRALASRLPEPVRSVALAVVEAYDAYQSVVISLLLAVIGVVVGFAEGLVGLVIGLLRLFAGAVRGIGAILWDVFVGEGPSRTIAWWNDVVEAVRAVPRALAALVTNWVDEFQVASTDRQTIMIGELTGQILALIASFGEGAAGGGGEAAAETGGAVGGRGGATLTVIEGGAARGTAVVSGGGGTVFGTVGGAALRAEEVTAPALPTTTLPRPVLVPPPVPEAVTATAPGGALAPAVAVATAARLRSEPRRRGGCQFFLCEPIPGFEDPLAELFCETVAGAIPNREYRVYPPGITPPPDPCYRGPNRHGWVQFDSLRGDTAYECKCGYEPVLDDLESGVPWRRERAQRRLWKIDEQMGRQRRMADDCGLQLRWYVSSDRFQDYLNDRWNGDPPVLQTPWDPCD